MTGNPLAVFKVMTWMVSLGLVLGLGPGPDVARAEAYQVVTAQKGDGIYRLLARHGLSAQEHLEAFIALNKDRLGPGNSLYEGRTYRLPPQGNVLRVPLLGKNWEEVSLMDHLLAGAAFYLVSGHGGPDPGGIGRDGVHRLYEDEYAYDVMLRLGRRLLQHGARVHFIIRDPTSGIREERYLSANKSEVCYPDQKIPLNQLARLQQRAAAVNRLYRQDADSKYQRCLVIHIDARRQHEKIDIFFYHHERSRGGKRLAETLRDTVEEKYHLNQPDRGYAGTVSTRGLYMLTRTDPPAVFIELGNIHHERDQKRLTEPNNRQALANWLCEGIIRDYQKSNR